MKRLPLTGIRVLAQSFYWAGPLGTRFLADLGAEVIKVEHHLVRGPAKPAMAAELLSMWAEADPGECPWNRSGSINNMARGKLSVVLDLSSPRGKDLYKELVKISDVVQDNYARRVLENLGLDYPVLREINPAIIMIHQTGFGCTGPYRDYIAGGCPTGDHGGLTFYSGYHDTNEPMRQESCMVDPMAGLHAGFAVLTALYQRRRTGRGQFIDMDQCPPVTTAIGDRVLGYAMNRTVAPRTGNRHSYMSPHGCYPCRGKDNWLAIAVETDEEWEALCRVMGNLPWTKDARFCDPLSRHRNQDELDKRISEWTVQHDHVALMHILQDHGVPAGAVLRMSQIMDDPHIRERGYFVNIEHPETGIRAHDTVPWKMSKSQPSQWRRAPLMGEHNRYVFGELLGLSDEEITELEEQKIIANSPQL
jgi:crotonobetainyl-CoA:carnitine CoA-transferase CaiB-like acyl-CoA transferase